MEHYSPSTRTNYLVEKFLGPSREFPIMKYLDNAMPRRRKRWKKKSTEDTYEKVRGKYCINGRYYYRNVFAHYKILENRLGKVGFSWDESKRLWSIPKDRFDFIAYHASQTIGSYCSFYKSMIYFKGYYLDPRSFAREYE